MEVVVGQKREREATESAVLRAPRLYRNLWPDLDAQMDKDAGSRSVQ